MAARGPNADDHQPQTGLSAFGIETPRPEVDANEADTDDEVELDDEYRPWHDVDLLDYLYNGPPDHSTRTIADDVFGGEVSGERIRQLLNRNDLMPETRHNRNARLEAEAKQQADDESDEDNAEYWERYTLNGREDVPEAPQRMATDGGRP